MQLSPSEIDYADDMQDSKISIKEGGLKGKIEFRDIWFRYPTRRDQWIFKGLNLTIEPNQKIAIVGESGQGKSTLISLLLRFYDPEFGQIFVDGKNVKQYNLHDLRKNMGLVM